MSRVIGLFALVFLTACHGGGPSTAPSPLTPVPPPSLPTLTPGRYLVTLLAAAAPGAPLQPDCTPAQLTPEGYLPLPVVQVRGPAVDDGQGGILLRPDADFDRGLELRLRPSTTEGLSGTVSGSVRMDSGPVVAIDGGAAEMPAPLSGFGPGVPMLIGNASGRMLFPGAPGASCLFGRWMMTRE